MNEECKHKWKVIEEYIGKDRGLFGIGKFQTKTFVLQCEKCGWIKWRNIPLPNQYWDRVDNE